MNTKDQLGLFIFQKWNAQQHQVVTVKKTIQKNNVKKTNGGLTLQNLIHPGPSLKQSMEAFFLDQRSVHTRSAYSKDLKRFIKYLLTCSREETLTRSVLIAYKEFLQFEGLEPTTIDRHLASLRSLFQWFVEDGLIDKSPVEGVRFLNPKRMSRTVGLSDEEVCKLLSMPNLHTQSGALHYAILMVLFCCGLRRSELCSLKMNQMQKERSQHVLRVDGKGGKERLVVLLPSVWNAIQYYLKITQRAWKIDDYIFVSTKNHRTKALNTSTIFYIVKRYAKLAGILHRVSPHSCRATAISNARDHHVPDRAIQEFAGWSTLEMITRYDKRKSAIVDSAVYGISYGKINRV